MRPDEHKKKKNTAYKKKHGIKDAGDKKDEKTKKDKSTAESKQERQTKHGRETKTHIPSHQIRYAASSRKTPSKIFRRRQIVSNWQKYELPPDTEEKISARGREAISHFRFKDELVWDDPGEATHDSSNDLAQSLACLPVHHILGISSSVFPTTGFAVHSDKNETDELSTNSPLPSSPEHDKDTPEVTTSKNTQLILTNTSVFSHASSVYVRSYPSDTNTGFNTDVVGQENCKGKSDISSKHPVDKLQLQDDDLDVLLNTNGPSDVHSGDGSSIQPRKAEGDSSKLCLFIPHLHSLLHIQKISACLLFPYLSNIFYLEAWLDSVLDG
ncbi:unnamed protein product [Candidula unifasciata]|uniref:Uncharacterized protein n=1 Tax=Candidula unifasciata TaxID=100452 RepID=A0A8S3Z2W5_9EUPU|nr:unnamed protein product [Candidula unifasciata]